MTRKILWLVAGGLLLGTACADPELENRLADVEKQLAELNNRVGNAPARPGAPATPANQADEEAAAKLYQDAQKAFQELNYDEARAKVAEIKEKYKDTRAARALARWEGELAVIGKPAADLAVEKWFQGNVDINKGDATLLVFWEVWCPHCKREVPKLEATWEKYKDQGLQMVGLTKLTRNITEQQVDDFIRENNITYPIAKEQGNSMSDHYAVQGVPAAAVVKDGKVVWRGHPTRLTDEMIKTWIGG